MKELSVNGSVPSNLALIDEADAARFLDLSKRCLQAWRCRGGGPPFIRISSRCIRYRIADLIAWSEERKRESTSQVGAA